MTNAGNKEIDLKLLANNLETLLNYKLSIAVDKQAVQKTDISEITKDDIPIPGNLVTYPSF